ncbi:hypothetical protein [Paenibacillus cremeus]|uniref:Uncharacterized protein n=1 Tax=Paenibacillus cremeus TaxID=2163881 RepID=A0A559KCP1_9BACL|nr:hypothetical protein [Paenibacillus cremeus]TVY09902.1 hypothetical protein FPZ49_11055 [Paenibacillus cremeus]
MRSIEVKGKEYKYFIGRRYVRIVDEAHGIKKAPSLSEVTGENWYDYLDTSGRNIAITAGVLESYIEREMI